MNETIQLGALFLFSIHRVLKKNCETDMWIDNHKLSSNHFVQETLANLMMGFLKTFKESDEFSSDIEIKIKKLSKPTDVDAHTYP
jgi:hypothetical protein